MQIFVYISICIVPIFN
uniref:Uncharacterized protein n=1 Tax=Rhizophora mucronata TaxID=61149 RepID=A0A2P2R2R3_RHIMU